MKPFDPAIPIQPIPDRFPAEEEQSVTLTYFDPTAERVYVAGTFNDWSPRATPLKKGENGEWLVRLTLEAGRYEYRFVVDGRWTDDPRALLHVANPYGEFNSVFKVELVVRTSIL
jgi:1,4-alpha-glucan branching enzyme